MTDSTNNKNNTTTKPKRGRPKKIYTEQELLEKREKYNSYMRVYVGNRYKEKKRLQEESMKKIYEDYLKGELAYKSAQVTVN
jgi:hypothetical protein